MARFGAGRVGHPAVGTPVARTICPPTACGRAARCWRYRRCSRGRRPWPALAQRPDLIPGAAPGDPHPGANTSDRYRTLTPGLRRTLTEGTAFVTARCQHLPPVVDSAACCSGSPLFQTPRRHSTAGTLPDAAAARARFPADRLLDQSGPLIRSKRPVVLRPGIYKPSSSASQVSLSGNGLMVSMARKSRPRIASPSLVYSPSEVSRSRSTEIAGPSLSVIRTIQ